MCNKQGKEGGGNTGLCQSLAKIIICHNQGPNYSVKIVRDINVKKYKEKISSFWDLFHQELDVDKLKKRAERFGAVSPAMTKVHSLSLFCS